ncbi:hypothetical protein DIPPA_16767 [Diplonema papillatum]|nr:hypothetical protein DIPPA_16767 [Diplonema papillatum]
MLRRLGSACVLAVLTAALCVYAPVASYVDPAASRRQALERYNGAVERWKANAASFHDARLVACHVASFGSGHAAVHQSPRCSGLALQETDDPVPAAGAAPYDSFRFEGNLHLSEFTRGFDPALAFRLWAVGASASTDAPPPRKVVEVPAYTWRWSSSHRTAQQCERSLGAWLDDSCLLLSVLKKICFTIAETSHGWQIDSTNRTAPGCTLVDMADFPQLDKWSAGTYSQVNATEVFASPDAVEEQVDDASAIESRNLTENATGPLSPYRLPRKKWVFVGGVSEVELHVRSVLDPKLALEILTNGTLNLDGELPTSLSAFEWLVVIFVIKALTILLSACALYYCCCRSKQPYTRIPS